MLQEKIWNVIEGVLPAVQLIKNKLWKFHDLFNF